MDEIFFDPKAALALEGIREILRFKIEVSNHGKKRIDDVRSIIERIDNLYAVLPLNEGFEALHAEYRDAIRSIASTKSEDRISELWRRSVLFFRCEIDYANKTVFASQSQKSGLRTKKLEDEKLVV
ncbi:MAG: hypothetical protein ACYDAO_09965 [Thermoplasmataceae archaeon]